MLGQETANLTNREVQMTRESRSTFSRLVQFGNLQGSPL